jgi:predicted enzyme related to lactoylglutathione lyase
MSSFNGPTNANSSNRNVPRSRRVTRRMRRVFLCTASLLLFAAVGDAQDNDRESGGFTGDIKPVLYVSDVEAQATFYRDVLGFEFLGFANADGRPYYAEMAAGGRKFGLHMPMSKEQESKVGQQRLYFRVTDLSFHYSRVSTRGGNPGEIKHTDWMDMFIVRDSDGNEIVFAFTDPAQHSIDPWHAP